MRAVMYHYVRPDNPSFPHFRHLRTDNFRRQLDEFSGGDHFVSREELEACFRLGAPTERGLILTFDDGFSDHYDHAFPELARREIPGIFYVSTGPLVTGKLLEVHRTHLLLGAFGGPIILEALKKKLTPDMMSHEHVREFKERTYERQTNDESTRLVKRTLNYFIDYGPRARVMDQLMSDFFGDERKLAGGFYLHPDQIREMHQRGMIIGSHTVTHPCLSKLSRGEQAREIQESFAYLERLLGPLPTKTFCYPYGGFHSFTAETEDILETNGCLFSFNVEPRDIEARDLNHRRQALPRYDCNALAQGKFQTPAGGAA